VKKVVSRKFLILYLIVVPLILIALEIYLSKVIKSNYIARLTESTTISARLIAEQFPLSSSSTDINDFCKKYKERTGFRITIISSTGQVMGDSEFDPKLMENHFSRSEIKEAAIKGIGSSIHYSNTLNEDFFYLAIELDPNTKIGAQDKRFLRLSMPLSDINKNILRARIPVIVTSIIAVVIAVMLGLIQAGRIARSIEKITEFSNKVRSGQINKAPIPLEQGEFYELAKNINSIVADLEQKLIQSKKEKITMEAILRNMSDGLMLIDPHGRILLSNSAAGNIFGINTNIEGKMLIEITRNVELRELLDAVKRNGEVSSQEIEIKYPKEIYLFATAASFYSHDTDNVRGIVLTFNDITKLKLLENVRKDFVANVSHEIKTPISAIKGFAETLLEGALDDKDNAERFLKTIQKHSERLNRLVDDLLMLSRIELGDLKIEKTDVDINDVVNTVFATVEGKAKIKTLYLKKEIPDSVKNIFADRDRLVQILLNLVDNSIKFTDSGGVTIRIQKAESIGEQKHVLKISVEDTGTGIPKMDLSRIGERFYRVDRARSRELGGTGLGLAIVKHLVIAHGWDMKIESTYGEGTKVSIFV
jgi:two-component system phosphate regulon sensor histidine kinase PhoR